jgi:hypothetical protein
VINEKLRLSIGAPPALRLAGVLFGLVFGAVGVVVAGFALTVDGVRGWLAGADQPATPAGLRDVPADLLPPELQPVSAPDPSGPELLGAGLAVLCGLAIALLGLYLALKSARTAGWLDGTQARIRGALRTRTVDLSAAEVSAGAITYRRQTGTSQEHVHRTPTLVARDPQRGRTVTIPLQGIGLAQLPPHELRALADAMTAGRPTDGRHGDVHTLAGQLRTMADNPLGL